MHRKGYGPGLIRAAIINNETDGFNIVAQSNVLTERNAGFKNLVALLAAVMHVQWKDFRLPVMPVGEINDRGDSKLPRVLASFVGKSDVPGVGSNIEARNARSCGI